jgi:hypothetical protein
MWVAGVDVLGPRLGTMEEAMVRLGKECFKILYRMPPPKMPKIASGRYYLSPVKL